MIKKHWKKIVIIMIIIIISMSIGAYAAYVLTAEQVSYNKNGTTVTVKAALDELYTKASNAPKVVFTQGQLVTYKGEQFYSLYNVTDKDTTMEIFAKTNLNSGATAQANAAYGTTACAFSSTNYWSSLWTNGQMLNLNNVTGYTTTDVMGKVNTYARTKGSISGRLLTKQEVEQMTGGLSWSSITNTTIKDMICGAGNNQGFEYYWLGSGSEDNANIVRNVDGRDSHVNSWPYNTDSYFGVRPVLTVDKSDVTNAS